MPAAPIRFLPMPWFGARQTASAEPIGAGGLEPVRGAKAFGNAPAADASLGTVIGFAAEPDRSAMYGAAGKASPAVGLRTEQSWRCQLEPRQPWRQARIPQGDCLLRECQTGFTEAGYTIPIPLTDQKIDLVKQQLAKK